MSNFFIIPWAKNGVVFRGKIQKQYKRSYFVFIPNYYLTVCILATSYFIVIYFISQKSEIDSENDARRKRSRTNKSETAKTNNAQAKKLEDDEMAEDEMVNDDGEENINKMQ